MAKAGGCKLFMGHGREPIEGQLEALRVGAVPVPRLHKPVAGSKVGRRCRAGLRGGQHPVSHLLLQDGGHRSHGLQGYAVPGVTPKQRRGQQ